MWKFIDKFNNGRSNPTAYMAYSQCDPLFQGERDFSRVANNDHSLGFDPLASAHDNFNFMDLGFDGTPSTMFATKAHKDDNGNLLGFTVK